MQERVETLNIRGKKSFTLIELLVCIGILASIGSFLILNASSMIARYQFESRVQRLARELEWTHRIATTASAYFEVTFKMQDGVLYCQRTTDEPLGFSGGNHSFQLEKISAVFFNKTPQNDLTLVFTHSGDVFPSGHLELISKKARKKGVVSILPKEKLHITFVIEEDVASK